MWIISRTGFVSLVEHEADPNLLRARARRAEHLTRTFNLIEADLIDLGPNAPDYRWHADVDRRAAADAMANAVLDIDYSSHVKEEVAGDDQVFYSAMMGCWRELYKLQDPPGHLADDDRCSARNGREHLWVDSHVEAGKITHVRCAVCGYQRETIPVTPVPSLADLGDIATQVGDLADKMLATKADPDAFGGYGDDVDFEPDWKPVQIAPSNHDPLPVFTWENEVDECMICGCDMDTGDRYVRLPEDVEYEEPEGPAHAECADDEGWDVTE